MNNTIIPVDDLIPMWGMFFSKIMEAISRNEVFSGSALREDKDSALLLS